MARTVASCGTWALSLLGVGATCLLGQAAPHTAGSVVQGTVVESRTGGAVVGATVELLARDAGWRRAEHTDELGRYRFIGVRGGDYELRVRAIGFQPRALQVSLGAASARISVGIVPTAVSLAPVVVVRQAPDLFARLPARGAAPDTTSAPRGGHSFMSLDARALDYDEVTRTVAPGEPDLMRTLLRHPAVESRDDYSTALWIRGAPWDESLVLFDGVPLFNPLHAAGAVSAINLDGLGSVTFLPTRTSSEHVGSASGQVAVASRRGTSDSTRAHVLGGLSVFSGAAALDGALSDSRADWMIAARRSHIDLVTGAMSNVVGWPGGRVPYDFADVVTRGGVVLREGWRAEASALEEGDRLQARIAGVVDAGSGRWGGFARRVSLIGHLPHGTVRVGAMWSGFSAHLVADSTAPTLEPVSAVNDSVLFAVRERLYRAQPVTNAVAFTAVTAAWFLPDSARGGGGVQLVEQRASDSTSGTWPHSSQVINSTNITGRLRYVALWGDRAWRPSSTWALRTGLRVETGGTPGGSTAPRYAPSASLRIDLNPNAAVSVSGARSYQYAQTLAPPGPGRNAVATTGAFWVVAGDTVPAARTDALTVAGEQRLGADTYATIAAYRRTTNGAVVPDPVPGALVRRPLFVSGTRRARGLEISARHGGARFSGNTSLVFARSTIEASGLRYDAPEDRRIAFRADGAFRLNSVLRGMLAFSAAGGVPFTRYHEGIVRPSPSGVLFWSPPPRIDEPSSARSNPYRSLDAGLEGMARWRAHDVVMYLQVRNVTGIRNDAAYLNTMGQCPPGTSSCNAAFSSAYVDTRLTPLRFFPAAGVRVAF